MMSISTLLVTILAGTAVAYFIGHTRSLQIAKPIGGVRHLATLPSYYASMVSLWAFIPAVFVVLLWSMFDGPIIESLVKSALPEETKSLAPQELGLVMSQVYNIASGLTSIDTLGGEYQPAVNRLLSIQAISAQSMPVLALIVLVLGSLIGFRAVQSGRNAGTDEQGDIEHSFHRVTCIATRLHRSEPD